jgi:Ca-activated chloride channel homolog
MKLNLSILKILALIILIPLYSLYIFKLGRERPKPRFALTGYLLATIQLAAAGLIILNPYTSSSSPTPTASPNQFTYIVLDTSASMLVADSGAGLRRLESAKQIAKFLVADPNANYGLISFAKASYFQSLAGDDDAPINEIIDLLHPSLNKSNGGTMAVGLKAAIERLEKSKKYLPESSGLAIILVSDGEDFNGRDKGESELIAKANKLNIPISTISLGTEKGGEVPFYSEKYDKGYTKILGWEYDEGNPDWYSKADPAHMREIAQKTGGASFDATNYKNILNDKNSKRQTSSKEKESARYYLDYLAIILLVSVLLLHRRVRA